MATIMHVANYFLSQVERESGSSITPLKLQKLVYYAQAWSLALLDAPLFDDHFEAWAHGPVNPGLYDEFRGYGYRTIDEYTPVDMKVFTKEQRELLDEVWDEYGKYDGKYLERLTHQEAPWKEARRGYEPGQYCRVEISQDSMKSFYTSLAEKDVEA